MTTHYKTRDPITQGEYFTRHMMAMTQENLHDKAEIAMELAHRDIEIAKLMEVLCDIAYTCGIATAPDRQVDEVLVASVIHSVTGMTTHELEDFVNNNPVPEQK